jgi:hypothetical protein
MKNYSEKEAEIKREIGMRLRKYCKEVYGMTLEDMAAEFAKAFKIDPPPVSTVGGWAESPPISFIFWIQKKENLRWEWVMEGKGAPKKLK